MTASWHQPSGFDDLEPRRAPSPRSPEGGTRGPDRADRTAGTHRRPGRTRSRRAPPPLALQLFAEDPAEHVLESVLPRFHVASKGLIHQRLIVPSTGAVHLLAEPVEEIRIDADRDP